ncbi:sigma-54-dependent Fis family transcriptional regulator [Clostridium botulinum]|uniref:sigma 54-interacting transcriptional regulator n=2 Tax=Clostridium botulinum TaxID=1491 RepID=UPI0004DACD94|nr:sigma 54-interacting transcriptional regulator [Clostridium botulinum]KEI00472.1 transcriptional regulator [Clostridium botulinum C/D str. BKT75002]KEI07302.1 transcriptional regulator [Clostridium botulinum C/D str. BKT2873]KGM96304.1 transcriptional regulator [Clostridium botulinum D str. CCUG 7971]KOC49460.1 transcriptional regulator [Clostridium botulinum]MCD3351341.1 sigma-54-dependent Fis family transcriptional regulator [Clostridium botulinum D/C]
MNKELLKCTLKQIPDTEIDYIIKIINNFVSYNEIISFNDIVTKNQNMKKIIQYAKKASNTDCNILLQGNSGTGKEIFAKAIHNYSTRSQGPFIVVNCKNIPSEFVGEQLGGYEEQTFTDDEVCKYPGMFQLADEGTIFLNDIQYLSLGAQLELLKILEENEIKISQDKKSSMNVRIICSSDNSLIEKVNNKDFRSDLYYKLNVINIKLIDLNERIEDISLLAKYFLKKLDNKNLNGYKTIDDEVLEELKNYKFVDNVRELRNLIEKLYYLCDENNITKKFLFEIIGNKPIQRNNDEKYCKRNVELKDIIPMKVLEKQSIENALNYCKGNVEKASKILGLSRATIYRKINKYGINLYRNR